MRSALVIALILTGCNLFAPVTQAPDDTGGFSDTGSDLGTNVDADADGAGDVMEQSGDAGDPDATDVNLADAAPDGSSPDLGPFLARPTVAYDFESVAEGVVPDVSGGAAYDLELDGDIVVENGGATIATGALQTAGPPDEFYEGVQATGEFAFSVWLETRSLEQGDVDNTTDIRRVVTLSEDTGLRNTTFAQWRDSAILRVRTLNTSSNGVPQESVDGAFSLGVQHHLFQFRSGRTEHFVDGEMVHSAGTSSIQDWDTAYRLRVGNEFGGGRQWVGTVYDLRLYTRGLTPEEVQQLVSAGVP